MKIYVPKGSKSQFANMEALQKYKDIIEEYDDNRF